MNIDATHTPGRWVWWTSNSWNRLRASQSGVDTNVLYPFVCSDGQPTIEVTPADMLLIAAAPELLQVARDLYALVATCNRFVNDSEYHLIANAASVISKAEGRS